MKLDASVEITQLASVTFMHAAQAAPSSMRSDRLDAPRFLSASLRQCDLP
eukprot:CAMPEP_0196719372 /NCGR_PEP_ID=MMETSP1091-20130531/2367_1 /TAXON_ID=302021 /ORGANISM="Rhodomonas sp., Strain CCMP768" /LENGTH=49 /DNA_ID= /DNA_START= /DNA_END= /DNA_ORIENTATION=